MSLTLQTRQGLGLLKRITLLQQSALRLQERCHKALDTENERQEPQLSMPLKGLLLLESRPLGKCFFRANTQKLHSELVADIGGIIHIVLNFQAQKTQDWGAGVTVKECCRGQAMCDKVRVPVKKAMKGHCANL